METRRALGLAITCGIMLLCSSLATGATTPGKPEDTAQRIRQETGTKAGVIVQLGCRSGKLMDALQKTGNYIIHGLDRSRQHVRASRSYLHSRDIYGPVSVTHWSSDRLPYVNNFADLIIQTKDADVSADEIGRASCRERV